MNITEQPFDPVKWFDSLCKSDSNKSEAVVAIEVLTKLLTVSDVSTVQGLYDVMNLAISKMCESDRSNLSVRSACELFQRFITLTTLDTVDFEECKQSLCRRAQIFIKKVGLCRQRIAESFLNYIPSGSKIFLYSYSRVVLTALAHVAENGNGCNHLHCYVTNSMPSGLGAKTTKALAKLRISCTLVPDTSMAYLMPKVDFVILGAEAVVESGGIFNAFGSSLLAMAASTFRKPVYVLAESFKFIRCYPLDQYHLPDEFKWNHSELSEKRDSPLSNIYFNNPHANDDDADCYFPEMDTNWNLISKYRVPVIEQKMPRVDYTSPSYITYLFTDLGVLTPSAVSDELIKLYL